MQSELDLNFGWSKLMGFGVCQCLCLLGCLIIIMCNSVVFLKWQGRCDLTFGGM
jgi:hypothetical protein